ncbi:hypothetical protein ACFWV1_14770 [Streptomyces sp. NPDC058700]|uniref:hypothetical protein n=1 Tax=unclassified Streptomyces TaxID=2593676 RepID=UPI003669FF58
MTAPEIAVIGGIDTHMDIHQAAVMDSVGRHLDTQLFETNSSDYEQLLAWLRAQATSSRPGWRAPAPTALAQGQGYEGDGSRRRQGVLSSYATALWSAGSSGERPPWSLVRM